MSSPAEISIIKFALLFAYNYYEVALLLLISQYTNKNDELWVQSDSDICVKLLVSFWIRTLKPTVLCFY